MLSVSKQLLMTSDALKVSVRLTSYNQENYIAQAIESVLMQKTDFAFEIVIGDDFSTDKTAQIVRDYQQRHPHIVRILKREKGDLYHQLRQKYGRLYNYVDTLYNCRGAYVAHLDGDDYWRSSEKLQRQADFLDANPDFSECFHNVEYFYENAENTSPPVSAPRVRRERYTLDDILRGNFICHSSVMFRRGLFGEYPEPFLRMYPADWPLHVLNAQYGDIGHIDEVMGVYRIHGGGVWSHGRNLHWFKNEMNMFRLLDAYFAGKHGKAIRAGKARAFFRLFGTPFHKMETAAGLALRKSGFRPVADLYRRIFYPQSLSK